MRCGCKFSSRCSVPGNRVPSVHPLHDIGKAARSVLDDWRNACRNAEGCREWPTSIDRRVRMKEGPGRLRHRGLAAQFLTGALESRTAVRTIEYLRPASRQIDIKPVAL